MKKILAVVLVFITLFSSSVACADLPDISNLTENELLELQANLSAMLAEKSVYTLLPGVYDCEKDFSYRWYNCKVLPASDGSVRTAIISFHTFTPDHNAFLTYEISSDDEGIKLSLLNPNSTAGLFLVIEGAALQAVPFKGM